MKKIEKPHTVYGIQEKRSELVRFLTRLDSERSATLKLLGQVDATLELFTGSRPDFGRYTVPDSGSMTEFRGFVAQFLRDVGKPVSIIGTADAWVRYHGLEPNRPNRNRARSRVDSYFRKLVEHGIIERVGSEGQSALWELVNEFPHD